MIRRRSKGRELSRKTSSTLVQLKTRMRAVRALWVWAANPTQSNKLSTRKLLKVTQTGSSPITTATISRLRRIERWSFAEWCARVPLRKSSSRLCRYRGSLVILRHLNWMICICQPTKKSATKTGSLNFKWSPTQSKGISRRRDRS